MAQRRSKIQSEIGQAGPFRSLANEALVALWRTADVVRQRVGRVVEGSGLTLQQYNVLRILRGAGPEGLHTLAVAGRMIERAPGITRMIDRLEARGLVTRTRQSDDRRCVAIRITDQGRAALAELDGPVDRADVAALGPLPPAELRRLIRLLDSIRDGGR